jgi:hypothetical protein
MHLHTMRALFASRDAFSVLLLSCIQPQLQKTVLQPGILYEFFVSVSSTCQKKNLYLIGDLQLITPISTTLTPPDLLGSFFDAIPTIGAIFETLSTSLSEKNNLLANR